MQPFVIIYIFVHDPRDYVKVTYIRRIVVKLFLNQILKLIILATIFDILELLL